VIADWDRSGSRRLLIVEDDAAALRQLRWTFEEYAVTGAKDRESALFEMQAARYAVVLLDLGLPPDPDGVSEGMRALSNILTAAPTCKVIAVTGQTDRENALEAIKLGAHDFYCKPIDPDVIRQLVARTIFLHDLEAENRLLAGRARGQLLPGVVGTSAAMDQLCRTLERAAPSDICVLLAGESGVGKEVLARALHAASPRADAPFVAINCAAIPDSLLESELFGHERGAFTGAVKSVPGHLERANGGTLLLDEIGDMPLAVQVKLLRFLQERVVQRVGGRKDIPIDVRVVSATHHDLGAGIAEGTFREDLYYRLAELCLEVPPLRQRPEDTIALAHHFLTELAEANAAPRAFAPDGLAAIARYDWPGNVRELRNRVKTAMLMADSPRLSAADLGFEERVAAPIDLKAALEHAECDAVSRAWAAAGGNVSRAASLLGVSRPTAYKLLRSHGLKE
jgi:two-component system NtrC family response regulator